MTTTYIIINKRHLREFLISLFGVKSTDQVKTIVFPHRHEANHIFRSQLTRTPANWKFNRNEENLVRVILPEHWYTRYATYLSPEAQIRLNSYLYSRYFLPVFFEFMHKCRNIRNRVERIELFMHSCSIDIECRDALVKCDYRNRVNSNINIKK